jgi:hypothetical protein
MIEIAREETFHCQMLADQQKGVDRQRLSARRRVGDEQAAVRQQLNERFRRTTAH